MARAVLAQVNWRAIQMKVSDLNRLDFRALQATNLRIIHKLGAINQQHKAENGHGNKPNVALIYSAHLHER